MRVPLYRAFFFGEANLENPALEHFLFNLRHIVHDEGS